MMRALAAAVLLTVGVRPAAASSTVKKLAQDLAQASTFEQKLSAVQALGRSGKAQAVEPLAQLLDVRGASPRLSLAVVRALGALKDESAQAPLARAWDYLSSVRLQLGDEMPPHLVVLREAVAEALGETGGEAAGEILLAALTDKDAGVVEKAARALGGMRDKRATEPLIELLGRGGAVGQAAFEALAEMGDARARAPLERAARHEDFFIQAQAAYALARLDKKKSPGQDDLDRILNSGRVESGAKSLAAYYLARLDQDAGLAYLEKELLKGTPARRALASDMLGKSGNARAAQPLLAALKSEDPRVRETAVRGMRRLGGRRVARALEKLRADADARVRAAAVAALAELGEQ